MRRQALLAIGLIALLVVALLLRRLATDHESPIERGTEPPQRQPSVTTRVTPATVAPPYDDPAVAILRGRVVDETERPAPNARVTKFAPPFPLTVVETVTTDENGRFEFTHPGLGLVHAIAQDRVSEMIQPRNHDEIVLHLARGMTADILVVDEQKRPIAGADVRVAEVGATTNAQGTVTLAPINFGAVVAVRANGYAPIDTFVGRLEDPGRVEKLTFVLSRAATIRGVVLAPSGPVANAMVIATPDRPTKLSMAPTLTDAQGRFSVPLPLGVHFELTVLAQGYQLDRVEGIDVTGPSDVVLRVTPFSRIVSGVVVDANDRPAANVHVSAWVPGVQPSDAETDTNAAGEFAVRMPDGDAKVWARRGNEAAWGVGSERMRLVLGGARVRGVVVDESGAPIAGVDVHAGVAEPLANAGDRTDENGAFDVGPLPPGKGQLNLRGSIAPKSTSIEIPSDGVRIVGTRNRTSVVRGRAVSGGTPVAAFRLHFGKARVIRAVDGKFSAEVVGSEPVRVAIVAPPPPSPPRLAYATTVKPDGSEIDLGDIELAPLATVSGRVLDSDGRPAQGAQVKASSAAGHDAIPWPLEGLLADTTDEDGRFTLPLYGPFPIRVTVMHEGRYFAQLIRDTRNLELRYPVLGEIVGHAPIQSMVDVVDSSYGGAPRNGVEPFSSTGEGTLTERFVVRAPPGTYNVSVTEPSGATWRTTVTVKAGETVIAAP